MSTSVVVGQAALELALLLCAIDLALVRGLRGVGKTPLARALSAYEEIGS